MAKTATQINADKEKAAKAKSAKVKSAKVKKNGGDEEMAGIKHKLLRTAMAKHMTLKDILADVFRYIDLATGN